MANQELRFFLRFFGNSVQNIVRYLEDFVAIFDIRFVLYPSSVSFRDLRVVEIESSHQVSKN